MVQIACGKWCAAVAEEWGGNLLALYYDGERILRQPESVGQMKAHPALYGIPLLLPANRVKNARFTFAGKKYDLPMNEPARNNHVHGVLKETRFQVIRETEASVTTRIENRGEYYPFPFEMEIEDTLAESGLTRQLTLKNSGIGPMPYTLAFHAAFVEPEQFSVPIGKYCDMDENYIPTGKLLPLTTQQQAYLTGLCPGGGAVSGCYTACGHTARIGAYFMTVSEQFDHWVLFNGGGGCGYLCIEPQCGAVDGLNNGKHRVLLPGEVEVFTVRIHK